MRSPQSTTSKEPGLERQLHRLDVADENPFAEPLSGGRRLRVELDPDDRVSALGERLREVPARAADVEHALACADGPSSFACARCRRSFRGT